ncbi:MAG: hypothetical protein A2161_18090 [Candidatus Schekmanbacteria bacterium RBG_13_48_7]|uniref:Uncharacterized protein n=1 Tax=Candidatus Schekmanbacteria bacterium RBG_13_48_7 TaxID=1817878 RepID=A0A1F7RV58_9BACT|nr:MAG: hypothetical protein A2161_18090 [Candidatus Schekmanbacteria bacterium RBG_13_48_7]
MKNNQNPNETHDELNFMGFGRKCPNPFSIFRDIGGFTNLKLFISSNYSYIENALNFDCCMEELAFHLEQLHDNMPEIQDIFFHDPTMYPVFYFSLSMNKVFNLLMDNLINECSEERESAFLSDLAQFLGVPDGLRERVIKTTRKFSRFDRYIELEDSLDNVMELLAESAEDTLLLIYYYYLIRIRKIESQGIFKEQDFSAEEFRQRILYLHENVLAELQAAG